jgi:prolyl 4-hydroxylase
VQRVPSPKLELFVVRDFLDAATCEALIERIDARRHPSQIADDQGIAYFRTSETCDLDSSDPLVRGVDVLISELLGLSLDLSEPIQGQRYAVGQEFKPHTDTFEPGGADYFRHCAETGNRSWTAMIYLNEPEDGGATRFKTIGKTVQPETGKLLAWNNLLLDGRPNPATLHQGMKVRRGTSPSGSGSGRSSLHGTTRSGERFIVAGTASLEVEDASSAGFVFVAGRSDLGLQRLSARRRGPAICAKRRAPMLLRPERHRLSPGSGQHRLRQHQRPRLL